MQLKEEPEASGRGCSPCCTSPPGDSPPIIPATQSSKPLLYPGDLLKPSPGTLPSSKTGFLVSFLVDARGGAMTGHRHWGMRVIIPPAAVQQPTRINCRYQQLSNIEFPPPLMEREALASRVIEISPKGEHFRSPVLIEIPHFASNSGAEREMVVLRSDDGVTWTEHVSDTVTNGEIYQDVVHSVVISEDEELERIYDVLEISSGRVIRILTSKFPKYFAIISRVREEVSSMSSGGGNIVLDIEPRLRVTFPKNAVYKKIKVGLQVQSVRHEIVQAAFGRSVEVSRLVAVEPRRRKFHQPIFVSIPLPCSAAKLSKPSQDIRLICSITGSMDPASWEDLTGSTPLEVCKDVVHFSSKVSGIFWLLVIHDQQRDPVSALTQANRLFREASLVPYYGRFSIFYRENFPRAWVNTLRVYCMTDDKAEKVIQSLQGFRPLAISDDIEVPSNSDIAVKLHGNVIQLSQDPFTGEMLPVSQRKTNEIKDPFVFKAFEENSLTLLATSKDSEKAMKGSLIFSRRLTSISATQQVHLCQLDFDVESAEVFRGKSTTVEAYEPVKENLIFHSEQHEEQNLSETTISNGFEKSSSLKRKQKPTKKKTTAAVIEDENPYEKIEVNNTGTRQTLQNGTENLSEGKKVTIQNKSDETIGAQLNTAGNTLKKKKSSQNKSEEKEAKKEKKKMKNFSQEHFESYRSDYAKSQGVSTIQSPEPQQFQKSGKLITHESNGDVKEVRQVNHTDDNKVDSTQLPKASEEDINISLTELQKTDMKEVDYSEKDKPSSSTLARKGKQSKDTKLNTESIINDDKTLLESSQKIRSEINDNKFTCDITNERLAQMETIDASFQNIAFQKEQERVDALMRKNIDSKKTEDNQMQSVETSLNETDDKNNKSMDSQSGTYKENKNITTDEENTDVDSAKNKIPESDVTLKTTKPEPTVLVTMEPLLNQMKKKIACEEIDSTFRNIQYEKEQERVDKLNKKTAAILDDSKSAEKIQTSEPEVKVHETKKVIIKTVNKSTISEISADVCEINEATVDKTDISTSKEVLPVSEEYTKDDHNKVKTNYTEIGESLESEISNKKVDTMDELSNIRFMNEQNRVDTLMRNKSKSKHDKSPILQKSSDEPKENEIQLHDSSIPLPISTIQTENPKVAEISKENRQPNINSENQHTISEVQTPPIEDIADFRNIAFENEQHRVDTLMRNKSKTKKDVKIIEIQKTEDDPKENKILLHDSSLSVHEKTVQAEKLIQADKPEENIQPNMNSENQNSISEVQTPPIEDIADFRNISFEKEQHRVDTLMRTKSKTKTDVKIKDTNKSEDVHADVLNETALDPEIAKHLKENIFISTDQSNEKTQEHLNANDVIGYDIEQKQDPPEVIRTEVLNNAQVQITSLKPTVKNQLEKSDTQTEVNKENKKKTNSFIKEWQQDLKEFFSLGKNKKKKSVTNSEADLGLDVNEKDSVEVITAVHQNKNLTNAQKPSRKCDPKNEKPNDYEDVCAKTLDQNIVDHIHQNIFIHKSYENAASETNILSADGIKEVEVPQPTVTADPKAKSKKNRKSRRKTNSESTQIEIKYEKSEERREEYQESSQEHRTSMEETHEHRRENSIMSRGKPKVVVPSPKGIPRPRPLKKSNRDSMLSNDSKEDLSKSPEVTQTTEFQQAVDTFDQLYKHQETEESLRCVELSNKHQETEESLRCEELSNKHQETEESIRCEELSNKHQETEESLKCEELSNKHQETEESKRCAELNNKNVDQSEWKQLKKGSSFEVTESHSEHSSSIIRLEKQEVNISDIEKQYEDSKLVRVLREFQESEAKRVDVMYVDDDEDDVAANVIQIEKHSLSLQDGQLVEEISTLQEWKPTEAIDPESLRNVDGESRHRKGSKGMKEKKERTSKLQMNKCTSSDETTSSFEAGKSTELSSRLEETTKRMRKVSQVLGGNEEVILEEADTQVTSHPLSRTSKVVVKGEGDFPLDNMIEQMVKQTNTTDIQTPRTKMSD